MFFCFRRMGACWAILLGVGSILAGQASASGATFVVSTGGNDSADGSSSSPWRTIQRCASAINAGDICLVSTGVYSELVAVSNSGVEGAPITLRAESEGVEVRGGFVVAGSYVAIEGFRVTLPNGGTVAYSLRGSHITVQDSRVSSASASLGPNNRAIELSASSLNNVVRGNYISYLCFGMWVSGAGHLVEGNEIEALTDNSNGACGDVDYVRFFGKEHVFRDNYFHGISKTTYECEDCHHTDCFQTYDDNGDQITDIVIEGNRCADGRQGVMVGNATPGSRGLIIRNNLFWNVGSWCTNIQGVVGVSIHHNLCDGSGGLMGLWCKGSAPATCEFKNNIIYGLSGAAAYGVMASATLIDGLSGAPGKGNLLFKSGSTINGYANDLRNVDPLFVSPTTRDYRLRSGSPATDAGVPIGAWLNATDIGGVPRPSASGWDIGPYEQAVQAVAAPTSVRVVP